MSKEIVKICTIIFVSFYLSACAPPPMPSLLESGEEMGRERANYEYLYQKGYDDELGRLANQGNQKEVVQKDTTDDCNYTLGNYPIALSSVSILLGVATGVGYTSAKKRGGAR
jgi:hypothetical protein